MAKILYIILVLNLFGCSTTQKFYIDKIQESNPTYPNQTYIFPKLNGKNISITRKINSNIIADFLEIDIEKKHQSIFENVWATKENSIPRLSDITYKINTLNSSLYSVSLKAEGCGAYCEYLSTTYNYDLIKGKKILLDDLLSNDGKIKLLKILTIRKKNIIKTHLKLLRDENISENTEEPWFISLFDQKSHLANISSLVFAEKLNNQKPGLHVIHFKTNKNESTEGINSHYQFELFVNALLLAQKQKTDKDIIWISSLGNQSKDTQLSTKPALLITPNSLVQQNFANETIEQLTSHMDLQSTLMSNWLQCPIDLQPYSNGSDLIRLNKDRIIANTSNEGLMVFNKDKSVFIDRNGNFQSYSSQFNSAITVNKDFPLMIDGVHFIKHYSNQNGKNN